MANNLQPMRTRHRQSKVMRNRSNRLSLNLPTPNRNQRQIQRQMRKTIPSSVPPTSSGILKSIQNGERDSTENEHSEDDLNKLYDNIKSIPNYSAKLNEFLRQNNVHSTHRRIIKKKFPRRHIIVHFPFQIFMGDLIEYTQAGYKHANNGHSYILIVIDVFTKMVYGRPVKKKDRFSVSSELNSI